MNHHVWVVYDQEKLKQKKKTVYDQEKIAKQKREREDLWIKCGAN